jgi:hypothetical protein
VTPSKEEKLKQELKHELELLGRSLKVLTLSYKRCSALDTKSDLSDDELIELDALTSRFARSSDILMQKIFGLMDALELEENGTMLDKINRACKRGIGSSDTAMRQIRELRNQVAHEYSAVDVASVFDKVLMLTPELIQAAEATEEYCQRFTSPTS